MAYMAYMAYGVLALLLIGLIAPIGRITPFAFAFLTLNTYYLYDTRKFNH